MTNKKVDFRVMSDKKCVECGKPIKQNLVTKKPLASKCYKCFNKTKGE